MRGTIAGSLEQWDFNSEELLLRAAVCFPPNSSWRQNKNNNNDEHTAPSSACSVFFSHVHGRGGGGAAQRARGGFISGGRPRAGSMSDTLWHTESRVHASVGGSGSSARGRVGGGVRQGPACDTAAGFGNTPFAGAPGAACCRVPPGRTPNLP